MGTAESALLQATTLWDYPSQSYGTNPKGNNRYAGVTPAFVIYNMVRRYTKRSDLVVDPMAGSGTTLDVCKEEGRKCFAYDVVPTRAEIIQNDSRKIPLNDDSADMVFIDPPYSDNIKYNDSPENIGNLTAEGVEYYVAIEQVIKECVRILKPGRAIGWLTGDQWVHHKFTPVGFKSYQLLSKYLETIDIVVVARRNQSSNTNVWVERALSFNFYLRGFKYLFLMKKRDIASESVMENPAPTKWTSYKRS